MDKYRLNVRFGPCTCGGREWHDKNHLHDLCVCLDYYSLDTEYMDKVKAIEKALSK